MKLDRSTKAVFRVKSKPKLIVQKPTFLYGQGSKSDR